MHVRRGLKKDDDDDDYFYKDAVECTREATVKTKRIYQYFFISLLHLVFGI